MGTIRGWRSSTGVWPGDNPFTSDRHAILRQVKHELGAEARHYNFNASSEARSIFRYRMHTLPDEVNGPIGTSTLFAAWNAAIYVAQIEDIRLSEAVRDGRYLEATDRVLKRHGGLWFNDETYVIRAAALKAMIPKAEPVFGKGSCQTILGVKCDRNRSGFVRKTRRPAVIRLRRRSPRVGMSCRSCGTILRGGRM
jgi:hypothetical protein